MKKLFFALLAATAVCGSALAQDVPRIDGADLLVDLEKYAGKQVIVKNVNVYAANNDGAYGKAGGVTIYITVNGIDPESFRYMLKNCSHLRGCDVRELLVIPTGVKILSGKPEMIRAKIINQ